jgi:D-alanyl-D-alanine carboxypeptidase
MAKIARVVLKNETLLTILSALKYTVPATNMEKERPLRTENYLIDDMNVAKYYDRRVKGGLASYSEASGANLFCTTQNESKTMELICVVLGCMRQFNPEPKLSWQVLSYGNFDEMVKLIDYVYSSFKVNRIVYDGQAMNQFPVVNGESDVVGQPTVNIDTVLPSTVHMDNMDIRYTAQDGGLSAPIRKGDQIATVELWYRNSCVAEAELYAMGDVTPSEDTGVSFLNESIGGSDGVSGFLGFLGTVVGLAAAAFGLYVAYNAYRRARRRAQRRRRRAERRRSW